jgi:F-type H+-transporting ATPase subunit b
VELNWSTFVLEIINFLILVWILKHFLYKPVLDVIARRRAGIEQTLAEAQALHASAKALQDQYENRLHDWEQEKQQARDSLQTEMDTERTRLLQELRKSLDQEQEKARVSEQRRLQLSITKAEETALTQGAQFATRLLTSAVGPELEDRLLTLMMDDLGRLSPERLTQLRASLGETPSEIHITSAFPLTESQRQTLEQALKDITQLSVPYRYEQDGALLAGLHISIGAWVLGINVRDELKGFAELAHES